MSIGILSVKSEIINFIFFQRFCLLELLFFSYRMMMMMMMNYDCVWNKKNKYNKNTIIHFRLYSYELLVNIRKKYQKKKKKKKNNSNKTYLIFNIYTKTHAHAYSKKLIKSNKYNENDFYFIFVIIKIHLYVLLG